MLFNEQPMSEERIQTRIHAHKAAQNYATAFWDIVQGKNLERHRQDVEKSIKVVDENIEKYFSDEAVPQGITDLKNNLFRLKWMILERS